MNTYNIIAIGGTGMRCAESFVHLCAMGMFDNTEINLLALDTDFKNGNFERLKLLVDNYNRITADREGVAENTLFSAKINYFTFSPDYSRKYDFDRIADYENVKAKEHDIDGVKWKESDLVDLFLTPEMRHMNLLHGYRAQTQMGSMLMYYAIKEEALNKKYTGSDLTRYVEHLMSTPGSIVFMFGSVFGGTGASSIPIMPHALQEAAKIISKDGQGDLLSKNYFGTVMLTNYFSFDSPNVKDAVYATSDKFALNSQAALSFYNEDETIKSTYKRLYLIGRDTPRNISQKNAASVTGGKAQCNPADYIELAAASAAYDFFQWTKKHQADSKVEQKETETAKIFYRAISPDEENNLTFESFFGTDKDKFAQRCGIMMASAFLFGPQDFANDRRKQPSFSALTEANVKDIRDFFRFFYNLEAEPSCGWIKQMQESVNALGYSGFLFNNAAFSTSPNSSIKFKYNELLYPVKSAFRYKASWPNDAYSKFKDEFGDMVFSDSDKTAVSALLKRTFDTFTKLYGF